MSRKASSEDIRVAEQSRSQVATPQLFRVLMHNDDYTTMEFVIQVLEVVFRKPPPEATRIMLNVHVKGVGLCGVFPFEIAETKIEQVHTLARKQGYPLKCSLEEA